MHQATDRSLSAHTATQPTDRRFAGLTVALVATTGGSYLPVLSTPSDRHFQRKVEITEASYGQTWANKVIEMKLQYSCFSSLDAKTFGHYCHTYIM